MLQKSLKKKQGLSLKELNTYQLTENINSHVQKQKDEAEKQQMRTIKVGKRINDRYTNNHIQTAHPSRHQSHLSISDSENKQKNCKFNKRRFKKITVKPIPNTDQNIQHLVQQITPKVKGFIRFGIKSYEKIVDKRILSDVSNLLSSQNLKGSLFIGQLWNNKMTSKFMKLNRITDSKAKFLEDLKNLKWNRIRKERQKQLDSINLIHSVRQFSHKSLKSIQRIPNIESLLSLKHLSSTMEQDIILESQSNISRRKEENKKNFNTFRAAISVIRDEISSQCKKGKEEQYWKNMKNLQKESEQMHKLWNKYFSKILQLN